MSEYIYCTEGIGGLHESSLRVISRLETWPGKPCFTVKCPPG
jgi:hypothetical protein